MTERKPRIEIKDIPESRQISDIETRRIVGGGVYYANYGGYSNYSGWRQGPLHADYAMPSYVNVGSPILYQNCIPPK